MTRREDRAATRLRTTTTKAYDRVADQWDQPGQPGFRSPRFARRLKRVIVDLLRPAEGAALALELGAGTGWILDATAPLFAHIVAIEPSSGMREVCRRRVDDLGLRNVLVTAGDATRLDGVADGSVDVVYAVGLLDAVPEPDRVFSACARVLKPGGLLVVSTSNGDCPWYWLRDRLTGTSDVRTGRYLNAGALLMMSRDAGFSAVDVRTWGAAPPRLAASPLLAVLGLVEGVVRAVRLSRYLGVLSASFRRAS